MKKMGLVFMIAGISLLFFRDGVNGEYEFENKETLRDIKSISVFLGVLNPDVEKAGLSEDTIQKDVELQLRMAGIKVVPVYFPMSGSVLLVNPDIIEYAQISKLLKSKFFFVTIRLQIIQGVSLLRNSTMSFSATTWETDYHFTVGEEKLEKSVKDSLKNLVDKFLNDYLAVNSIQSSTPQRKQ